MTEQEENITPVPGTNTSQLSEREIAIIQHLADGLSTGEVAEKIGITFHVAQNSLKAIRAKLGVSTASAVVAHAFRHNLIK